MILIPDPLARKRSCWFNMPLLGFCQGRFGNHPVLGGTPVTAGGYGPGGLIHRPENRIPGREGGDQSDLNWPEHEISGHG